MPPATLTFTRSGPGLITVGTAKYRPPIIRKTVHGEERHFGLRYYEMPLESPVAQAWLGWGHPLWSEIGKFGIYVYIEMTRDEAFTWQRNEMFDGAVWKPALSTQRFLAPHMGQASSSS